MSLLPRSLTRLSALILLSVLGWVMASTQAGADTRIGTVFSTAAEGMQSYLRLYNVSGSPGQATVLIMDFGSGQVLGQWISPPIPGGAEQQYDISTIEAALPISTARTYYYSLAVQAGFDGYLQHVLWRAADGTLTNLSTCSEGVTGAGTTLVGVHSSLLNYAYPSTVIVNNTGVQAADVTLGVYDARDGAKLGAYTTPQIAAGAAQTIPVSQIESAIGRAPSGTQYHYVIKAETAFTGFFENLVENLRSGVTTDMTNECAMNGAAVTAAALPVRIGAVFSTAQTNSRSYLRFFNTGDSPGTITVTVRNQTGGQVYGSWTSGFINPGAEQQFGIDEIERAALGQAAKPQYYTMSIQTSMRGYFQHVLWRVTDGTLTNLSTCGGGVTADLSKLTGIHSTLLAGKYPSAVAINNLGAAASVRVGIYDSRDGTKLGAFNTPSIAANGMYMMSSLLIEGLIGRGPSDSAMYHYVFKIESPFNGFVQHLVNNLQAGVVTDMTIACAMNQ